MVVWQSLAPAVLLAYLASVVALAHLANILPSSYEPALYRKGALVWAKSTGRDDRGWNNKSKGLDTSNLMSSVEAETGPTHAQVLRRKEKQEEGISGMQMSRNGQPIGERL